MNKLTENQFHTVWTIATDMEGYDKSFFQKLFAKLQEDVLIIPEHSKELRLSPDSNFHTQNNDIKDEIYRVLEEMDIDSAGQVGRYLNTVSPNLTVCPKCHVDDFVHVESCEFYQRWNPKD